MEFDYAAVEEEPLGYVGPDDLEPGFYRAEKAKATKDGENPDETPPAHFQVTESSKVVLVYPNGERVPNAAAVLLLKQDLLPVSRVTRVPRERTPFADDVQPRPDDGPDPVEPVE